jgi:zinc protease
MPKKGKIIKETYNSKFDYKELELSNGARAILKKTDFKKNEIQMQAEARGGSSLYGEEDWVNIEKLDFFLMDCGLGNFSRTELEKATAGKQVDVYFAMSPYDDFVSGNSTVKDLETMFQLTYLTFTDIKIDEKNFNQNKSFLEDIYKNRNIDHESVFLDSVIYILNNHDWRCRPFNVEDLKKMNRDRMMEIVENARQ